MCLVDETGNATGLTLSNQRLRPYLSLWKRGQEIVNYVYRMKVRDRGSFQTGRGKTVLPNCKKFVLSDPDVSVCVVLIFYGLHICWDRMMDASENGSGL